MLFARDPKSRSLTGSYTQDLPRESVGADGKEATEARHSALFANIGNTN